jgi:putative acetyltransferase
MRTAASHLRRGVARQLLQQLLDEATRRRYQRLSLETGPLPGFAAAHALYRGFGFEACGPFGSYRDDPFSVFMTRRL